MQPDLQKQIDEINKKVDAIYESMEKMRRYMMWTGIITLAVIVLPLIGLALVIPSFLANYTSAIETLGI